VIENLLCLGFYVAVLLGFLTLGALFEAIWLRVTRARWPKPCRSHTVGGVYRK